MAASPGCACWEPLLGCVRGLLWRGEKAGQGGGAAPPLLVNPGAAAPPPPVAGGGAPAAAAAWAWPKRVLLVRHGESTFNRHYREHGADPGDLWDAPLTTVGEEQARAAAGGLGEWGPVELVLTSPLSRAVKTCLLALPPPPPCGGVREEGGRRYEVCALLAESLTDSCDIGRPPRELAAEFPELCFGGLPEVWWYVPEEHREGATPARSRSLFADAGRREAPRDLEARVDRFAQLLAGRAERTVAIFGHSDYFNVLLHRHFAALDPRFDDYWLENCEVLAIEVPGPASLLALPSAE